MSRLIFLAVLALMVGHPGFGFRKTDADFEAEKPPGTLANSSGELIKSQDEVRMDA